MEDEKIRFLQELLEEKNETDVSRYVLKMRELEERARNCYAEPVNLNSEDFVEMLLLDGCFIVQFIRLVTKGSIADYFSSSLYSALIGDMLLMENQLPFFVIRELFTMIESADHPYFLFLATIVVMCDAHMPGKGSSIEDIELTDLEEIMHLFDFNYHCCYHPSTSEIEANGKRQNYVFDYSFIRCATELREAGIKFQRVNGNTMFHIRFENGTLYIPELKVENSTEPILRNLIAFEQLILSDKAVQYVTDYMVFMDHLIDSPKDVELLSQNGIIKNFLGDAAEVATMINGLGTSIIYSNNFYYTDIFGKVNEHCSRRRNKWMANLKHNYFNTPWTLISVAAAALLLLLTVVQTIFSILSYAK